MQNLIFLCYGREIEYSRTVVSVLSYFSWSSDYSGKRVIIYTDKPDFFAYWLDGFPVEYVILTSKVLSDMLGGSEYIHRRKICVVDETFRRYPHDDLLYADSDTLFISAPSDIYDNITANTSYMHVREYTIEEAIDVYRRFMANILPNAESYPQRLIELIESQSFLVGGTCTIFSRKNACWNSGILGLSKKFARYLPDVFALNDRCFEYTRWFISEQLAFSFVGGSTTQIRSADHVVYHYWRAKGRVDSLIDSFLDEDFQAISTAEKLRRAKKFAIGTARLIDHENYLSISLNSFRRHNYRKAVKFGIKSAMNMPRGIEFIRYCSYRFRDFKNWIMS